MTPKEKKILNQFREEVFKHDRINNEYLYLLLTRFTQGNMGRSFFNEKLKHKYYTFLIKILHKEGTLVETEFWGVWNVNKENGVQKIHKD